MSAFCGMSLPEPDQLLTLVNARDSSTIVSTTVTNDAIINGGIWTAAAATYTTEDGIPCFNHTTANQYATYSGPTVTLGQNYTLFYHCKIRISDSGWRTFHRNNLDHLLIGENGSKDFGMYSNRNGAFRDSGYDLIAGDWQTIIATGEGDSPTSSTGTTSIYVNGVLVGTCDRVGCGTSLSRMGYTSQPLGHWSIAGIYNKTLTPGQITQLHRQIQLK